MAGNCAENREGQEGDEERLGITGAEEAVYVRVEKGNTGTRALREKGVFRSKKLGMAFLNLLFCPMGYLLFL